MYIRNTYKYCELWNFCFSYKNSPIGVSWRKENVWRKSVCNADDGRTSIRVWNVHFHRKRRELLGQCRLAKVPVLKDLHPFCISNYTCERQIVDATLYGCVYHTKKIKLRKWRHNIKSRYHWTGMFVANRTVMYSKD